jgi:hypothetical protein
MAKSPSTIHSPVGSGGAAAPDSSSATGTNQVRRSHDINTFRRADVWDIGSCMDVFSSLLDMIPQNRGRSRFKSWAIISPETSCFRITFHARIVYCARVTNIVCVPAGWRPEARNQLQTQGISLKVDVDTTPWISMGPIDLGPVLRFNRCLAPGFASLS